MVDNPGLIYNSAVSRQQVLLIKSAVYAPDVAIGYWKQWKLAVGIETCSGEEMRALPRNSLDFESRKILPQIYYNLLPFRHACPCLQELINETVRCTFRNKRLWQLFDDFARQLNANGIQCLVFKGGASALRYYQDKDIRHLGDLDLFTTEPDTVVRGLLKDLGCFDKYFFSKKYSSKIFHAAQYGSSKQHDFDVHRFLLHEHLYPTANALLLRNSAPYMLGNGAQVLLPSPTVHLFLTIVHGTRSHTSAARLLWIADSYKILAADYELIDWDELLSLVTYFNYAAIFNYALPLLKDTFNCVIPDECIRAIKAIRCKKSMVDYLSSRDKRSRDKGLSKMAKSYTNCVNVYQLFLKGRVDYSFAGWIAANYLYRFERRLKGRL
jgi:hypothetical protein